mgnify:CR=1 FL=1
MYIARLKMTDGSVRELPVLMQGNTAVLRKDAIPMETQTVDFLPDFCNVKIGSEGFYVVPSIDNDGHAGQIFFDPRGEQECEFESNDMPLYVFNTGSAGTLAVVAGMALEYSLITGIKDGFYYMFPRFILNGEGAYEDIEVRFFELTGSEASWCGAARRYRRYQLERGACEPIRDRMKKFPVVGEAALGPEVRVRLAWKPVPKRRSRRFTSRLPLSSAKRLSKSFTARVSNTRNSVWSAGTNPDTTDASPIFSRSSLCSAAKRRWCV